jgi:hypothetical protein
LLEACDPARVIFSAGRLDPAAVPAWLLWAIAGANKKSEVTVAKTIRIVEPFVVG